MRRNNWLLLPIPFLVIAILPLHYGFYETMRGVVCTVAAFEAQSCHKRENGFGAWTITFTVIAVLFNPVVPIHSAKAFWMIADLVAATLFYYRWNAGIAQPTPVIDPNGRASMSPPIPQNPE